MLTLTRRGGILALFLSAVLLAGLLSPLTERAHAYDSIGNNKPVPCNAKMFRPKDCSAADFYLTVMGEWHSGNTKRQAAALTALYGPYMNVPNVPNRINGALDGLTRRQAACMGPMVSNMAYNVAYGMYLSGGNKELLSATKKVLKQLGNVAVRGTYYVPLLGQYLQIAKVLAAAMAKLGLSKAAQHTANGMDDCLYGG